MARHGFRHSNIGALLGPYNYVGENIAAGSAGVTAGASARRVDALRRSPRQHPGARLHARRDRRVLRADGSIWLTEDFGRLSTGIAAATAATPPVNPVARPDAGTTHC